ncbi:MAG TPA: cytochrome c-type biogenesis CcmF C-terminal domain-containing protein [Candidatus Sulfotelmatobacter sp.]|jgi:cytochrome c-type biogenesis protein CcmF|nr:cytochrome c-type biogenesis CcmF C-terminal domain-containing protein [Candidatus Sulfotelmatobacter sp.]
MAQIGSFALLLAFALSLYCFGGGLLALFLRDTPSGERLSETARRAGVAIFGAVVLAAVALVVAAFRNDFTIAYIFHHSNRDLPGPYKFATLWSGQEGSLLFWSLLLAGYGFVLRLRHKTDPRLFAYASVVIAGVQIFFLSLVNFAANPFGLLDGPLRPDGSGLNPLLQYPEMVIHPPMLYLGYVGFTVPFAFALGALIMKYPGEKWIHITRRWTMVTWGFLTCGIFLGAHWAYAVLGWGGYWGWDPVENASLMPWLVGTAFLHSVIMQEKRGMLKVWNMWLVFATFWLAILGTFLTRSGIIASVHAFAQSSIGTWFAWFLGITFVVFLFFFLKNKGHLRSEHKLESLVSRESSFLFNNLLFLLLTLDVLWGTWFPKISELVQGNKVTVGAPFYNRVAIPVALLLVLLTAIGPLLAWRKTSFESLKRNFMWQTVGALVVAVFFMATPSSWGSPFGLRPWQDISYFYSLMAIALAVLVTLTVASEFYRGGKVISGHTGQGMFASMVQLTHRNTRRYGGYIVHFGVVVVIIGLAGAAFNQDKEQAMGFGDKMEIGPYTLVCQSFTQDDKPNAFSEWAILDVYKGGKKIDTMTPVREFFKASQQASTKPDIRSNFNEDLYLVYEGQNEKSQPIIKAHLNPLVMWIWLGVWIMLGGTILGLVPNAPTPVRVAATRLIEHAAPVATGD